MYGSTFMDNVKNITQWTDSSGNVCLRFRDNDSYVVVAMTPDLAHMLLRELTARENVQNLSVRALPRTVPAT